MPPPRTAPTSPRPRQTQTQIQIPRLLLTPLGQIVTVVMLALLLTPLLLVILLLVVLETILHLASRLWRMPRPRTRPPMP